MAPKAGSWSSAPSWRWRIAALLSLVLLGFGLRLYRLDSQSLWVDEATSAHLTTLSPRQIVLDRADNLHSPMYFLALAAWSTVAGRSEFSLRFFSVWTGLLLVPVIYRASQRLFRDRRTSLIAALLAAISPASIVYSQETRMYVILPVAYLLILTAVLGGEGPQTPREWLLLGLGESLCLYIHAFGLFVILAVNVLLLVTRLRRADGQTWRLWLASQALAALSYVPWLFVVWHWGSHVPDKLSRSNWQAKPMPLTGFVHQLWTFMNSGLVEIGKIDAMRHLLAATGILFGLGLALTILLGPRRRLLQVSAAALLVPLAGTYAVWYLRPLAHPRYVLFLLAPLLLIMARVTSVLARRPVTWAGGLVLLGLLLSSQAASLSFALLDKRFFRYDTRALSEAVAARSIPGEAALMPPGDYSLHYYDPAPAEPVNLPGQMGTEGGRLHLRELGPLLEGRPGAFVVSYVGLRSVDPRNYTPFILEHNGRLAERFSVDRMQVEHYLLEPPWVLPEPSAVTATCGPLQLTGVYSQTITQADDAVTIALRWQLLQPTEHDHKTVVQLWDDGHQIAASDNRLLNDLGRPTSLWERGEEALNTHVLPLPMGTPPLTYTLRLKVYGGGDTSWQNKELWLRLGHVQVSQAVGQTSDPYGSWSGTEWQQPLVSEVAPGLILEGYAMRPEALKPSDTMHVSLRWRAGSNQVADCAPSLLLAQDGEILEREAGRLFSRYPTAQWAEEELLIETRELFVPATLEPLDLLLEVDGRNVAVARLGVAKEALMWTLPDEAEPICARLNQVGSLIGYTWKTRSERPNSGLLTLYWRASSEAPAATSYTVFVHLFSPEGHLLAQHDGLPAGGERPTTTWVPNEVIADEHRLQLDADARAANLSVGMYDWQTGERLSAYDCAGNRWPDDAIPLTHLSLESSRGTKWASTSSPGNEDTPKGSFCRDQIRASVTEATVH